MERRSILSSTSQQLDQDNILVENKATVSVSKLEVVNVTFDYPIETDVTIVYFIGSNSRDSIYLTKGSSSVSLIGAYLPSDDFNPIVDIIPLEEDGFIYTWEPYESTTFEFPLYLNTKIIEKTSDYLYRSRECDEILTQLIELYVENGPNDHFGDGTENSWPKNFFSNYKVFIDGYLVTYIRSVTTDVIENIQTNKNYGDYDEVYLGINEGELFVEGVKY